MKRKRSSPKQCAAAQQTCNPFRLLDLPAELRSNIFLKVLDDYPRAYLKSTSRGKLASRSALPRVSRQVREEFLAVVYLHADVITKVIDFDFAHVVTFFNRLRETELKALSSTDTPLERRMFIQMSLTSNLGGVFYLKRWLNRAQHPTKKGVHVNISYVLNRTESHRSNIWAHTLWMKGVNLPDGKKKIELNKITKALEDVSQHELFWPDQCGRA